MSAITTWGWGVQGGLVTTSGWGGHPSRAPALPVKERPDIVDSLELVPSIVDTEDGLAPVIVDSAVDALRPVIVDTDQLRPAVVDTEDPELPVVSASGEIKPKTDTE
jgi:hypothetical protein